MSTISIGGQEIVVGPKRLLDYIEKVDFIKMRRATPYDLVRDFPDGTQQWKQALAEIAMRTVYTNSSSVDMQEELMFDKSEEGFFWSFWKCLPSVPVKKGGTPETWQKGINRAKAIWERGTAEEKTQVRFALEASDERSNLGNSDGPSESSQSAPGQNEPSLPSSL